MIRTRDICCALAIQLVAGSGAAAATGEQLALLKTFRAEFVEITPGEGAFPRSFAERPAADTPQQRPEPEVVTASPFAVAKYEVPQNLWQAVMGSNPSRWKGPRNSVEMVSYDEAVDFCRRTTVLMRDAGLIAADQRIRLPTEAEWEYCARAGTSTVYSFGDDAARLPEYAWFTGNASGNDPPVGAKRPNPWGLYDVHGYLWEWCSDAWQGDEISGSSSAEVGDSDSASASGERGYLRAVRGGSWKDGAEWLTSSARRGLSRNSRDDAVGLRCVLAAE